MINLPLLSPKPLTPYGCLFVLKGMIAMWFKRKPKVKEHQLRWIGLKQISFHRPMRCIACEKTYIMDMFGGWGIEYDFTVDKSSIIERIDNDEIENAINKMMEVGSGNWIQVDRMACDKI